MDFLFQLAVVEDDLVEVDILNGVARQREVAGILDVDDQVAVLHAANGAGCDVAVMQEDSKRCGRPILKATSPSFG